MVIKTVGDLKNFIAGLRDDLPVDIIVGVLACAKPLSAEVKVLNCYDFIKGDDGNVRVEDGGEKESLVFGPVPPPRQELVWNK